LQSYLVRGSFAERVDEPARDHDPDDWAPIPLADMNWVEKTDVLKALNLFQRKKKNLVKYATYG
jgi:hypothetical protein